MVELTSMTGKPVAVMGLGKTGLATADALTRAGAEPWVWDDSETKRAEAEVLGYRIADLATADLTPLQALVWSPGIPHRHPKPHPAAVKARAAGLEPVCDIDLLGRAQPEARYIGITGTNGKSTTTSLIAHVMAAAGRKAAVGGNLGTPVLTLPAFGADGTYVLEMSSYQLELTFSVTFDVAVLLNITPDHLDRHGGMTGYIAAKRRIFAGQDAGHTAVIGVDDALSRAIHDELKAEGTRRVVPVSAQGAVPGGVYTDGGWLIDDSEGQAVPVAELSAFPTLLGRHNHQNAAAAFAACRAAGVPAAAVVAAMATFAGLAHRQQTVATIRGVRFVNDSKATNADAAEKALATFEPIYWILGGRAKDTGLNGLEALMPRVRHAFLIGEATELFAVWLTEQNVPYTRCRTLGAAARQAAEKAWADALPGAAVVLSPACASFDQFDNFEKRGDAFVRLVHDIQEGAAR